MFGEQPVLSNTVLIITVCVKVANSTFLVTNKRTKWAELSRYIQLFCKVILDCWRQTVTWCIKCCIDACTKLTVFHRKHKQHTLCLKKTTMTLYTITSMQGNFWQRYCWKNMLLNGYLLYHLSRLMSLHYLGNHGPRKWVFVVMIKNDTALLSTLIGQFW